MYVRMCMVRKEHWRQHSSYVKSYFPHTEILKHNMNRANIAKSKHSLPESNSTGGINSFYNVCTLSFCSVQTFICFQNIIFLKGCSQSSPLLQMRQKLLTWLPQVHTQATGLRLISLKIKEKCPSPTAICKVLVITALLVYNDFIGETERLGRAGDVSQCFQSYTWELLLDLQWDSWYISLAKCNYPLD